MMVQGSSLLSRSRIALQSASRSLHMSAPCLRIYDSISETIGRTPIVKANRVLSPATRAKGVNLYLKCEYFNPLGSVKDRLAIAIMDDARDKGLLKPGQTVVEATSGNTGISLAMICAQRDHPFVAVMSETFSVERRRIMRALGAKVVLTPGPGAGYAMVMKAKELAEHHGWFLTCQFENEANPKYHACTTGPEIVQAFTGKRLDYFVSGYGTGGTFVGVGRILRAARPETRIVLLEPTSAPLVKSGIKQEVNADGTPSQIHPSFQRHAIQGWTPAFVPKIMSTAIEQNLFDEVRLVDSRVAMEMALKLCRSEGIFTGVSGGATAAAAAEICESSAPPGASVLAVLPDTMERYMSTPLFELIPAEATAEEMALSKSTPSYQQVP